MMVSKHFSREEFACKCGCGFSTVDVELLKVLEVVREHFRKEITITSACRCELHNKSVKGKIGSYHLRGIACDIRVKGIPPSEIAIFLDNLYPDKYGIGRYNTFTHIDVRDYKGRW